MSRWLREPQGDIRHGSQCSDALGSASLLGAWHVILHLLPAGVSLPFPQVRKRSRILRSRPGTCCLPAHLHEGFTPPSSLGTQAHRVESPSVAAQLPRSLPQATVIKRLQQCQSLGVDLVPTEAPCSLAEPAPALILSSYLLLQSSKSSGRNGLCGTVGEAVAWEAPHPIGVLVLVLSPLRKLAPCYCKS